jgi:hypothetical protein
MEVRVLVGINGGMVEFRWWMARCHVAGRLLKLDDIFLGDIKKSDKDKYVSPSYPAWAAVGSNPSKQQRWKRSIDN